jgi:tetratricopeptide (TPR) repeat protein
MMLLRTPDPAPALSPTPAEYPAGVLIDPVVSVSDPTQRYVLYLPKTVDLKTPRPILYVMDYRGRGRFAAELFQPAAERLGWIIMSSYNTASDRTGAPNASALQAMWRDSHDRFTIDDRRTYLAGLSGTARMATLIAGQSGAPIAGVIGAGAGFPPDVPPSKEISFLYYGTAGTIDYNYWEMRSLDVQLTRLGKPHRIAFFDGPHAWMPPELAMAALCWMELRAMQAGQRGIDRELVQERWTRDLDRSQTLEAGGLVWEASQLLKAMAGDYAGLRPAEEIAETAARADRLAKTLDGVRQAELLRRAAFDHDARVHRRLQIIAAAFPKTAEEPAITLAQTIWNLDIAKLRDAARAQSDDALAAARVLAQLQVQTGFYLPEAALADGEYEHARFYLGIAEAIDPNEPYSWYLRSAVEARQKRFDQAVAALKRAVALGFRTLDAVEHDPAFDTLRQRSDFAAVVDELRAKRD